MGDKRPSTTLHVKDLSKSISWYAGFLDLLPCYVDDSWALFEDNDIRLLLINGPFVKSLNNVENNPYLHMDTLEYYLTQSEAPRDLLEIPEFNEELHETQVSLEINQMPVTLH